MKDNALRIFDELAIRDTATKQPDPIAGWKDAIDVKKIAFGIENDLDQSISVQPIGKVGGAQGNMGSATTISANSTGVVTLNLQSYWAPYISVSLTCANAPSSGKVTVNLIWI